MCKLITASSQGIYFHILVCISCGTPTIHELFNYVVNGFEISKRDGKYVDPVKRDTQQVCHIYMYVNMWWCYRHIYNLFFCVYIDFSIELSDVLLLLLPCYRCVRGARLNVLSPQHKCDIFASNSRAWLLAYMCVYYMSSSIDKQGR